MNVNSEITPAGKAFGKQASSFDTIDAESEIIHQMRMRVYAHTEGFLQPSSSILELNAGTGIDACHFAERGHSVLATDISEKMLAEANLKIEERGLGKLVKTKQCSFTELNRLNTEGKFDHIFSNFGGLNCVDDFAKVGRHFNQLLKPGGYATLVMISPFCIWETSLALKGNFKLAFRRFKRSGTPSHLEGVEFKTYYFWPSDLKKGLGGNFELKDLEGLAIFAPPPYLEGKFKNKSSLNRLFSLDDRVARWPMFRLAGDHFIATFQYLP